MKAPYFIYCFLFLAAVAFIDVTQASIAAGFGVSPSAIDFTVEKGSAASRQLIIYNTGPDAQFTAVSEDPAITVKPDKGILGKDKSVVTVTATGRKVGKSSGEILISLLPNSGKADKEVRFSLGTRVGVSVRVLESAVPSASPFVGMLTSAGIVAAGLSAYLPVRNKLKRQLYSGWRRA